MHPEQTNTLVLVRVLFLIAFHWDRDSLSKFCLWTLKSVILFYFTGQEDHRRGEIERKEC